MKLDYCLTPCIKIYIGKKMSEMRSMNDALIITGGRRIDAVCV